MIRQSQKTPQIVDSEGRLRQKHLVIWEEANGPIEPGTRLYFKNGDKTDVRLSNLAECSESEYRQRQQGATKTRGVWRKPCTVCGEKKPIDADHWYLRPDLWPRGGRCRQCERTAAREAIATTRRKQRLNPQPPS